VGRRTGQIPRLLLPLSLSALSLSPSLFILLAFFPSPSQPPSLFLPPSPLFRPPILRPLVTRPYSCAAARQGRERGRGPGRRGQRRRRRVGPGQAEGVRYRCVPPVRGDEATSVCVCVRARARVQASPVRGDELVRGDEAILP
jgi:hypothetical protein